MPTMILHGLNNQPIEILSSYIKRLIPIDNHAYFPEFKTQIILEPSSLICAGCDNWIYVKETREKIKSLLTETV